MKKYLAMLVLALFGMVNLAHAVGLGELVMESGLNEPLKARIPLIKAAELNEEQLRVQLASEADFAARQMARDYFYQTFRFRVDLKHPAGPSVIITTQEPVKEPSLDFLVELSWPTGRLLKDFTVLLDNPGQ